MSATVKMKRSAVALSAPSVSQLALGELAINTTDGKLFLKKSTNGVESIVDVTGPKDFKTGTGANLCVNSDFSDGLANWTFPGAEESVSVGVNIDGSWIMNIGVGVGTGTVFVQQLGMAAVQYHELQSDLIPVEWNKRYIVSAYTGAHRCNVDVFVYCIDFNGNIVKAVGNDINMNVGQASGGSAIAGYYRHAHVIDVDSSFSYCRIVLRKHASADGVSSSYLFAGRVMFEEVGPSATAPGPWAPCGVTKTLIDSVKAAATTAQWSGISGAGKPEGTNTGDETATTIKQKLGISILSGENTGDQHNIAGNAGTATALWTMPSVTPEASGVAPPPGLTFRAIYDYAGDYPVSYGNLISLGGPGSGQIIIGWPGTTGSVADNFIRSKRDMEGSAWSAWSKIITDHNIGGYSPSLTGVGASGSWGISITGNANTASALAAGADRTKLDAITGSNTGDQTSVPLLSGLGIDVWNAATLPLQYPVGVQSSFVQPETGFPNYGTVLNVKGYVEGGGTLQLFVPYGQALGGDALKVRFGNYDVALGTSGNSWTAWKTLLASDTFNSYVPTLTGSGATGTWSIAISGNAATATKLATARTINGVAFDGSANISLQWIPTALNLEGSFLGALTLPLDVVNHGTYVQHHLMSNSGSGVTDGGSFINVLSLARNNPDGMVNQLAFSDNNNMWLRGSSGAFTTWGGWKRVWDSSSLTNLSQLTNGPGYTTNTGTVTAVTGTGAINSTGGTTPAISIDAASTTVPGTMSAADKVKLNAITGSNTGDQISITGNAGTATKLAAARTINGVAFDGSASITINAVDATARQAVAEQDIALIAAQVAAANDATAKVNAISIGGRNLAIGSSNGAGWQYDYYDGTEFRVTRASTGESGYIYSSAMMLDGNTQMTVSFESMQIGNVISVDLFLIGDDYATNNAIWYPGEYSRSTSWVKNTITFIVSPAFEGVPARFRFDHNGGDGTESTICVRKVKLEHGNKSTDWTPPIEDVDADVTAAINNAQTLAASDATTKANAAALTSTWDGVTGAGKPADGATVGAPVGTYVGAILAEDVESAAGASAKANTAQATAIAASAPLGHIGSGGNAHAVATSTTDGFISASDKVKLDNITGTNTGDQINITGNAATATKLATARTINGLAFDGSANINIPLTDLQVTYPGAYDYPFLPVSSRLGLISYTNSFTGLNDGGTNHYSLSVMTGGINQQLAFTANNNMWLRGSATSSTWSAWRRVWDSGNLTDLGQLSNSPGYTSNLGTVTAVTGTGAITSTGGTTPVISITAASTTVPGTMSAADKAKLDAVTGSNTGDETLATIKSKLGITTLSGSNTGDQTTVTGNAGTATKLAAARTINGVAFDGSASITINAVDATARQAVAEQDIANGYVGLTLLKINFKNALNTFTSFFANANTAARTYTFPDKSGTIATTSGDSISVVDHAVTGTLLVSTTVTAQNATVSLPVTSISGGIITTAPAAAITLTMPTGTAMCAEMGTLSIVGQGISWSIINTSASFAATLAVGTSHTLVGDKVIASGVSARFTTVESGVNTCVTYRIA